MGGICSSNENIIGETTKDEGRITESAVSSIKEAEERSELKELRGIFSDPKSPSESLKEQGDKNSSVSSPEGLSTYSESIFKLRPITGEEKEPSDLNSESQSSSFNSQHSKHSSNSDNKGVVKKPTDNNSLSDRNILKSSKEFNDYGNIPKPLGETTNGIESNEKVQSEIEELKKSIEKLEEKREKLKGKNIVQSLLFSSEFELQKKKKLTEKILAKEKELKELQARSRSLYSTRPSSSLLDEELAKGVHAVLIREFPDIMNEKYANYEVFKIELLKIIHKELDNFNGTTALFLSNLYNASKIERSLVYFLNRYGLSITIHYGEKANAYPSFAICFSKIFDTNKYNGVAKLSLYTEKVGYELVLKDYKDTDTSSYCNEISTDYNKILTCHDYSKRDFIFKIVTDIMANEGLDNRTLNISLAETSSNKVKRVTM